MPRKKQTKAPAKAPKILPAAMVVPKKTSGILVVMAVLVVLFFVWLLFSMAGFFLPFIVMPFSSMMGHMGVSEFPNFSETAPTLKAPADYRISQMDDYPVSMEVTLPWFNLGSRGNFNVVSNGLPVSLASPGEPDWKTEWRVYQDTVYDADLNGAIHHEQQQGSEYFLVDIPEKNVKAKSSGQTTLTFSLAGVKEGDTFPVKYETSDMTATNSGAQQDTKLIHRDPESGVNINYRGTLDPNSTDTYKGQTFSITGTLVKDNGEAGAIITIGSADMPQAYKDATKQVQDIARQYNAPGGLQNLYDDNGRINNDSGIASMDAPTTVKPLRIFLATGSNQNQNKDNANINTNTNSSGAGIANPASVYCEKQGGKLEIRTAPDGGQTGYCHFPNGKVCEEWKFFRGECKSN